MRRLPLLTLLVLATATTAAPGQSREVAVSVGLDANVERNGARMPVVYLRNLLDDSRWDQALDNSLPLIVSYTLQTWRSRDGWIDELVSETEWQTIVVKEPLQEEYSVTLLVNNRPLRPLRFAIRDSAQQYLNRPQRVEIVPPRPGRFYYTLSVRIRALSDRDMDQLERFLAGDPTLDIPEPGNPLGRGIRRFLLKIAGMPSQELQAQSDQFVVRSQE
jgi:hypothetical protein